MEQLDTTLHSESSSVSGNDRNELEGRSEEEGEEEGEEGEGPAKSPEVQEDGVRAEETIQSSQQHRLMTSPEASLFMNLVEATSCDQEGARYFPPKKSPL